MKKYYCSDCNQEFTRRWNRDQHQKKMHGTIYNSNTMATINSSQPSGTKSYHPSSKQMPSNSARDTHLTKDDINTVRWRIEISNQLDEIYDILKKILLAINEK